MTKRENPKEEGPWPELPKLSWADTLETLHMWSQIVGKIRMELSPWVNHSWSVPLYVTPRGLTTSSIPYGGSAFQIDFDFVSHTLPIVASDGGSRTIEHRPVTVAEFYSEVFGALKELGIDATIRPVPSEIPKPIPFPEDEVHGEYNKGQVEALRGALVHCAQAMGEFRARFTGKVSPVHLFWGAFDLAVTRFSGRKAPQHPGGIPNLPDEVTREAYSHEVSSAGFWLGNREAPDPIFYSYAYPTPDGFSESPVQPDKASWLAQMGEFVLPYEVVRSSDSPEDELNGFFQSTYEAAANLANWDRDNLEWKRGYRPLSGRS